MSYEFIRGYDVWQWPEFQAFAKRLGIPFEMGTKDITIQIPCRGEVVITQEYFGEDRTKVTPEELAERVNRLEEKGNE